MDQLGQARECLSALQEGLSAGVQRLQRLRHELDFTNASTPELHVPLQLVGLEHLVLDAALHGHYLPKQTFVDGPWIPERLDHFQELRCQRSIARHPARFDHHHPLPALAPLCVVILVAGE